MIFRGLLDEAGIPATGGIDLPPLRAPTAGGVRGGKVFRSSRSEEGVAGRLPEACHQSLGGRGNLPAFSELVRIEPLEGVDDGGIELVAALTPDLGHRPVDRPGCLVGAFVGECVKDVCEADDATEKGDLLASQAGGVAAAVPPLVVGEGDLRGNSKHARTCHPRGSPRRQWCGTASAAAPRR